MKALSTSHPIRGPAEKGNTDSSSVTAQTGSHYLRFIEPVVLFHSISHPPAPTRKAYRSQMRACEFHRSHMEMRMCPADVQSTAQALLFNVLPQPSDQPFKNKLTDDEERDFCQHTFPRRAIKAATCHSVLLKGIIFKRGLNTVV